MTTYADLQSAIIADTHRADQAANIPRFIRLGEGLIRRDLRAYELTATLTNSDRVTAGEGLYNLPGRVVDIRAIHLVGRQGDGIQRVMPGQIRRLATTADVVQYAQHGDGTIEFRGVPSDSQSFEVRYFGTPAPLSDTETTNTLLTDHEGLYQAAAQFYLYSHTQDRELAQDQADIFDSIIERLNEQMARKIGGGAIAPIYNFSSRSAY